MKALTLDTANLNELRELVKIYPFSGISSNPKLLAREGRVNYFDHLKAMREIVGPDILILTQVVATDYDGIMRDADLILKACEGEFIQIKIPMCEDGLRACRELAAQGVRITLTTCFTADQGMLAVMAGAKRVAYYYTAMLKYGLDAKKIFAQVSDFIAATGADCLLSGANITSPEQISDCWSMGCGNVGVGAEVLRQALVHPVTTERIESFTTAWEAVYGAGTSLQDLAK